MPQARPLRVRTDHWRGGAVTLRSWELTKMPLALIELPLVLTKSRLHLIKLPLVSIKSRLHLIELPLILTKYRLHFVKL